MDECIELNIKKVWIHKSIGGGSYHQEAVDKAKAAGIMLIPGECPMMFLEPVDPAHKCMQMVFQNQRERSKTNWLYRLVFLDYRLSFYRNKV
ncbi:MAG: hypothetical protein GVY07_06180, partial [Bacteroidetes bacterium]|jgi:hypothetical protein|nr:hypothetical protein [Bacteroidota bacterium]